jgi:hypothetical protein
VAIGTGGHYYFTAGSNISLLSNNCDAVYLTDSVSGLACQDGRSKFSLLGNSVTSSAIGSGTFKPGYSFSASNAGAFTIEAPTLAPNNLYSNGATSGSFKRNTAYEVAIAWIDAAGNRSPLASYGGSVLEVTNDNFTATVAWPKTADWYNRVVSLEFYCRTTPSNAPRLPFTLCGTSSTPATNNKILTNPTSTTLYPARTTGYASKLDQTSLSLLQVMYSTLIGLAPTNGTIQYCADCSIANPCAGSGTGAFAKRLNGAWVCN